MEKELTLRLEQQLMDRESLILVVGNAGLVWILLGNAHHARTKEFLFFK